MICTLYMVVKPIKGGFSLAFSRGLDKSGALLNDLLRQMRSGILECYVPHPGQARFHRDIDIKERIFLAGNQSGKTYACLVEDLWYLTGTHPCFTPISERNPNTGIWLNIRETWDKKANELTRTIQALEAEIPIIRKKTESGSDKKLELALQEKKVLLERSKRQLKEYRNPPKPIDWPYIPAPTGAMVGRVTCANEDIIENVMVPALRKLLPQRFLACSKCNSGDSNHAHEGSWNDAWSAKNKRLTLASSFGGRQLEFKTYKQYALDPLSHDSAVLHFFHWDEEPQQKCYVINKARLSTTNGPTIGSLTPANASEWIVTDLVEKEVERDDLKVYRMEIHDNPIGDPESIKRFLDSIADPAERLSREKGVPGYLRYRVFKEYNDDHFIDMPDDFHEKTKGWPRTVSIDPADAKPNAVVWVAWDIEQEEPVPYVYRERKIGGTAGVGDVETLCKTIRVLSAGEKIDLYLIDRSSMRHSQLMNTDPEVDLIFELFRKFFPDIQPVGGAGTYDPRIEKMHKLFKVNPSTGERGAFVFRNCPMLDWELRHYSYKQNLPSGEDRKYQMVNKKNDDLLDAFAYAVLVGAQKPIDLPNEPFFAAPPIFGKGRVM